MQSWRVDDGRQTLVLAAQNDRLPQCVYWGPTLPAGEDLDMLARGHQLDVTGGMLDENPDLSICPEAVRTFPGQPGLILRDGAGTPLLPKFCFAGQTQSEDGLELVYTDTTNSLTLTTRFAADAETRIITMTTALEAAAPVHLHWLAAPVLPGPQAADEMIDISGRWCGSSN